MTNFTGFFTVAPPSTVARWSTKYHCERCGKWFVRDSFSASWSCCVIHVNECCHAFETEVHKKGWRKKVKS